MIRRLITSTLERALAGFPAVLVTGPRQSGKTTLLRNAVEQGVAYVSFDDPLEANFALQDPEGFLARFDGRPVILDEIQYVPGLLRHIKLRIDAAPEECGRWRLTGSQQFNLMRDVGESLAGRVAVLELPPFSHLEYPATPLGTAIWNGGYPAPALNPAQRDLWLSSYLATYIERDVRQLKNITDLRSFSQFLALMAASHGQEFHKAGLARDLGLSQPTIAGWAGVLEASYLGYFLPPYWRNLGKRVIKSSKFYFFDSALVCALTRQPGAESALIGPQGGALLEGWIVMEAYKVFAALGKRPPLYFWRSQDGLEVDLLIEAGGRLHPVEIKLTASPNPQHTQPMERFRALVGELASGSGLLVCQTPVTRPLPHGHLALPWQEFSAWLMDLAASAP